MTQAPLIGVSACFFHHDPKRAIFKGKRLVYLEESMGQYLMHWDALPLMIPNPHSRVELKHYLEKIDGLVLQGGVDMAPDSYGEKAIKPEWSGDSFRDQYEMELIRLCIEMDKPVLGICRGLQVINVALGGTLYQDIETQVDGALVHRDWNVYDELFHKIELKPGSRLSQAYQNIPIASVNSVHHQGIKDLGKNLSVEAISVPDGIVEAISLEGPAFVYGVQWHPEFMHFSDAKDTKVPQFQYKDRLQLNPHPLMKLFLDEVRKRRK